MLEKTSPATLEKLGAARASVYSAVLLTGTKAVIGFMTGSLGILAEALHSLLDLVAAFSTWMSVHYSERPADARHHYGHWKVENLSAMWQTLLLLLTCFWVAWEAIERLAGRHAVEIEANLWGVGVMLLSILVDWYRAQRLYRTAKKHNSQALEADALHFSSDILSSSVVIVGLVAVRMGHPKADPVAALLVSGWILVISLRLGVRAVSALLDTAPAKARETIANVVQSVEGVEKVSQVRVRQAGPATFADINIALDGDLSLHEVHRLLDQAEDAIRAALPGADVVVHAEPLQTQPADRELLELVKKAFSAVIAERGLHVTHIRTVQGDDGIVALVTVEFPASLPLKDARREADQIEKEVLKQVPQLHDVVANIDVITPVQPPPLLAAAVPEEKETLAARLREKVLSVRGVTGCHELVLTPLSNKPKPGEPETYLLSVHVSVEPETTVAEGREVARSVEEFVRASFPHVHQVHVHQEASG